MPLALLVLAFVLGLSLALAIPFAFAACTIAGTLALLYVTTQFVSVTSYATNLVELIGLGLAVDYSLLIVCRFREELAEDDSVTSRSCGRWPAPGAPSSSPGSPSRSGSRCCSSFPFRSSGRWAWPGC